METRILIPKDLQILFKNSQAEDKTVGANSSNLKFGRATQSKGLSLKGKRDGENKEKPTSSSGRDVEDSDFDSEFAATEPESSADDDTDCEGLKISKIWNPSYNLRRPRVQEDSGGDEKNLEEEDDEGKDGENSEQSASASSVVVANADSNGQVTEGVGKVGHFSQLQLCAGRRIEKGTVLSPNEGEVAVFYIRDVPPIASDDIRFIFGCFDRIINDDPKEEDEKRSTGERDSPGYNQIRLCNWVRFLKQGLQGPQDSRVNCKGKFVDRHAVFEFTRALSPGEEVVAFLDLKSLNETKETKKDVAVKLGLNQAVPLDLSKSPETLSKTTQGSRRAGSSSDSTSTPSPKSTVEIFPFSINSVLQPSKLFQPYSQLMTHREPRNIAPILPPSSLSDRNSILGQITGNLRPSMNFQAGPGVRPILRTRGRERSLLPCEVCGKAFDRPSLLKRHMRTHTGEKPHICDVCSKGFSTSSSLNTHRRIHSGEKPHQCPICGKRFTASSNLYYHRMTHNKEKPHKCLLCGKSFPTPGDLKSHQYVHSGSWPYNCPVCHRGFSKQTNLRNHLLLHSGDKPHTCQVCGKKFALACNLRAHIRTHEEEPISSCISCKRTFLSSLNMLDNGQCRTCIIHQEQNNGTTTRVGASNAPIFPATITTNPPATSTINGVSNAINNSKPMQQQQGLVLSVSKLTGGAPTTAGVPSIAAFPGTLNDNMLGFPSGLPSAAAAAAAAAGYIGDTVNLLRPNPFLEQLFQWNWRFAKETAGNLGLMQQKLLESRMLAAQLMSVTQNPAGGGGGGVTGADLLKFRL